jgi:hypothetical protein
MAVLVSKMDHCLFDLLIRQRNGELRCDIPVVISNHPDLSHVAGMFGVDYEHLGIKKDLDKAVAKQQQEAAIEKVCTPGCLAWCACAARASTNPVALMFGISKHMLQVQVLQAVRNRPGAQIGQTLLSGVWFMLHVLRRFWKMPTWT